MNNNQYKIYFYQDSNGEQPVLEYLKKLKAQNTKNRIFFVSFTKGRFVLLHHFLKSTQKTPKKEIEKAKKEYQEIIDNGGFEDEE